MRLLDSNILIYASKIEFEDILLPLVVDHDSLVSEITRLESLGYRGIHPLEKEYLESVFKKKSPIAISEAIINKAIELRQQRKMSAGDAIHAATALLNNLELNTRNDTDFNWINGLKVVNPIP